MASNSESLAVVSLFELPSTQEIGELEHPLNPLAGAGSIHDPRQSYPFRVCLSSYSWSPLPPEARKRQKKKEAQEKWERAKHERSNPTTAGRSRTEEGVV